MNSKSHVFPTGLAKPANLANVVPPSYQTLALLNHISKIEQGIW